MQLSTELEEFLLEEPIPEYEKPSHGVCSICYDRDSNKKPMYSLCGKDVTDEPIVPEAEVINKCKECLKAYAFHIIEHALGKKF